MLHQFIDPILHWIAAQVEAWGYLGIVVMMAIESANIPLPSEAIMPTAGILVQQGKMDFHLAALAGAIGCVVGSIPSYFLGLYADRWVDKYGDWAFFICRMLPVVRTFISFPAGVLKAHFGIFVLFTFIGSWIWCYFLTWVGVQFGNNMEMFRDLWHKFDVAIVLICGAGFVWYLWRHLKH
jgi:membrane protein DedA with SNARE-associated domain